MSTKYYCDVTGEEVARDVWMFPYVKVRTAGTEEETVYDLDAKSMRLSELHLSKEVRQKLAKAFVEILGDVAFQHRAVACCGGEDY